MTRPTPDELIAFMRTVKLLDQAQEAALREAEKLSEWHLLRSREILWRQGDKLSSVYLLISGKVRYERRAPDGTVLASGELPPGEILGDVAYLRGKIAATTIYSVRDSQLMSLPYAAFESLLFKSPPILMAITSKILREIERGMDPTTQSRTHNLAILPLSPNVNTSFFAKTLCEALEPYVKVGHIDKKQVESELGRGRADLRDGDSLFAENLRFFSKQASEHQVLVFEGEYEPSAWSSQCVREADRLLFVGQFPNVPMSLTQLEHQLLAEKEEFRPASDLVILYEGEARPANSASFLKERKVERHFHIGLRAKEGFERLARALSGRSIGLVLGGGGVRAAAHIGLIRVLQEEGIPIDEIGGTSIGAVIGALLAKGHTTQELEQVIVKDVVQANLFNDYVPPFISLVRGKKFSRFLRNLIGDICIEDLLLPFFAVTTNMTTSMGEVWDRGKAWEAVRASASLPAIVPPFVRSGSLYLDGGLVDNAPYLPMRDRGLGKVIVSDVSAATPTDGDRNLAAWEREPGIGPSFWTLLRAKISKRSFPGIGDVVTRSMVIGSRERMRETQAKADLYIRQPIDKYGMLDFKATADLVEVGYRHARENFTAWKKILEAKKGETK